MKNLEKIILMTTEHIKDLKTGLMQQRLFRNYTDSVVAAGGCPIVLTNMPSEERLDTFVDLADGLMLCGGFDVSPQRYTCNDVALLGECDIERDDIEFRLLEAFVNARKPVFGICRGMQLINCYFGGNLWEDLPTQLEVQHRDIEHEIICEKGSRIANIMGEHFTVNSFHHQAIKELGDGLIVTAKCGDIIEAIEHTKLPIWAVQFHPERMCGEERYTLGGLDMEPLFKEFLSRCITSNRK